MEIIAPVIISSIVTLITVFGVQYLQVRQTDRTEQKAEKREEQAQPRLDRKDDLEYERTVRDGFKDASRTIMVLTSALNKVAAALRIALDTIAAQDVKIDNMPKVIADLRRKGVIDAAVEIALRDALVGLGMELVDQPPTGILFPMAETTPVELLENLAKEKETRSASTNPSDKAIEALTEAQVALGNAPAEDAAISGNGEKT